jgi:hypothetical protein
MRKLAIVTVALISAAFAAQLLAVEAEDAVTLEGAIVCAKCTLKEEGRDQCQNVLLVESGEETQNYYLVKTEASEDFGHVCMAKKYVRATGTVSEKDGKTWLAATVITPVKSEG